MCPTAEEVSQWLWMTTISGAKGNIFWSLNSRSSGVEAGEWALLDYQDNNSDRMDEAAKVAKTLADNKDLFANAKVVESGINILYVRESLWAEDKFVKYPFQKYEARKKGAVIKSALAYFEMFTEMGINTNFKSIDEYNFTLDDYSGETIILSHQICISVEYVKQLENFVAKGGTLIVDGLTGYFDENVQNTMKSNFLFENLFGANISEFKVVDDLFDMQIAGLNVKAHLWRGTLDVKTADVIGEYNGKTIAVQNQFGKGKVLYIPSMVGLASRKTEDYTALSQLVSNKLDLTAAKTGFGVWHEDVMMKTMYSGKSFISLIINKSGKAQEIGVTPPGNKLQPEIIFQNKKGIVTRNNININNEETIIIHWK
jgi:beta-galactosidase